MNFPDVDRRLAEGRAEKFKLYSVNDVFDQPPPKWLIEGLIEESSFGVLYGPSGEGKSFVALDWSLCIATGSAWHGRKSSSGPVVYVVAEGGRGVGRRLKAWMQYHCLDAAADMFIVLEAVQLRDPNDVDALLTRLRERSIKPALVVFDTLARCFVGGDENASSDMGIVVDACNRVQRDTSTAVLVVHHTTKASDGKKASERGSSALRGAADVMLRVHRKDGAIHLKVDKQKDDEPADDMAFRLHPLNLGYDAIQNRQLSSCVLVEAKSASADVRSVGDGALSTLKVLATLPDCTASSGVWRKETGLQEKTFQNHRSELLQRGFIKEVDGRRHTYQVTEAGTATAKVLPFSGHWQNANVAAATATPPIGVAGGTREASTTKNGAELTELFAERDREGEDGDATR